MRKVLLYIIFFPILVISSFSQYEVDSVTSDSCYIHGYVTNGNLGSPLKNVEVILINLTSNSRDTLYTDSVGIFTFRHLCLKNEVDYNLSLNKKYYLPKTLTFKRRKGEVGMLNLNSKMNLDMISGAIVCFPSPIGHIDDFLYNSGMIMPDSSGIIELDKLVKFMKEDTNTIIEVGSHTDCIGSEKSNLRLSDRRARAVIDYVVANGIAKDRIFGKGYGETVPLELCDCKENNCSEDQHALNRRTEFRIVSGNGNLPNSF